MSGVQIADTNDELTPTSLITLTKRSKAYVNLDDLLRFLFPSNLQHPLVAGRLIAFGLYGPLDEQLQMRTGPQRRNVVSDWQLDLMCVQIEREDILNVYLHKKTDMPLLTKDEQESIISQADKHLKSAKGRAMLPPLTREDVIEMFKHLPRDEFGRLSFDSMQEQIVTFRTNRVTNFKRVFPKLTIANGFDAHEGEREEEPVKGGEKTLGLTGRTRGKRKGKVSEAVAPKTMFLHMKGSNNADVIQTTNRYLNQFASKISELDGSKSGNSVTANVRLLREVEPRCPNPYMNPDGTLKRPEWDSTSQLEHTGLGSMVKAAASSSTWKRNATLAEK